MSTSWLKSEPPTLAAELLARLREKDNPFDDFVQSRRPGGAFHRRHVAAVNRGVFEKLEAAIQRYRLEADAADNRSLTLDDVPRSGVLLVLGPRGSGKTHLVHALQLHDTGAHVIAPTQFEPHRPFAEYLLQLVVGSLQEAHATGPATCLRLADWLARRVAVQALYGLTDTQWLARQSVHDGVYWRRLFGWGSRAMADRRELLIKSMREPNCRTLHEACRVREYAVDDLRQMTLRQVEESETSGTIGGQIRRGLYVQLVKLAFDADANTDPLLEFLLDGFTQVDAPLAPSRETMVEELLAALTELFLLFGRPLVFAFDALETLLSDPPDEKKCHAFFRGLAEVLDSHRGLPLLVFAEAGHWEQAQRYLSSYAQQRLQQGVPTRGHGSVRLLSLPPVGADVLEQLISARLSGWLTSPGGQPAATPLGPFCREDLVEIARSGADAPPLRQMLQALRDLYQERVFGDGAAAGLAMGGDIEAGGVNGRPRVDLMEIWLREHKAALRRIESEGIESQAGPLHLGLQRWLECLSGEGASANGWTPARSEIVAFGASPAFGQLTRCRWQAEAQACDLGISFLLGQRANMPRDLKEKLRMMASSRPVVPALLILWPHLLECAGPAEKHLPPATRKIWDDLVAGPHAARIWLRSVDPQALAVWLAIGPWEAAVREEGFSSVAALQHFLAEATGDLLPLITPQEDFKHACVAAC